MTPPERAVAVIRAAMLIRTAVLEGSTFFGLMVLLIAATSGSLFAITWIWVNVIPLATIVVVNVLTFPTASRLEKVFEDRFRL